MKNKNKNKRYNINEITRETYYQLPKVFFTKHSKYENLSLSAAVAFSFLKDRFNYSIKNNWVDEHGDIYFIFTNAELGETLKVKSNATVVKIKKELEKFGLLDQQRMGLNQPNRLYLLQPEVTATDVYELNNEAKAYQALEPQGSSFFKLPEKEPQSLQPYGNLKNELPENSQQSLQPYGSLKIKHNLYKELEDTNNKIQKDTQLDFSKSNYSTSQVAKQNVDLINHFNELLSEKETPKFLNNETTTLITHWCKTPAEMYRFIQIILNAKKAVANDMISNGKQKHLGLLQLENLQTEMTTWVRNYFNRIRTTDGSKKKINNYENYLYKTIFNNLTKYVHQQLQNNSKSAKE